MLHKSGVQKKEHVGVASFMKFLSETQDHLVNREYEREKTEGKTMIRKTDECRTKAIDFYFP